MSRSIAYRYYEGIKIRTVAVPNSFGGPESDEPRLQIRGLIVPTASEEAITGAAESSTGSSRGGRNKILIEALLYTDGDIEINESDRVEDHDGTEYSVVGVGGAIFGSHQVAFLEKIR